MPTRRATTMTTVRIDLGRVRANAADVARRSGAPLMAVVKADAYGLGARAVARALADLACGFYAFDLREAVEAGLRETGRPTLALEPVPQRDPAPYLEHRVRPAVWSEDVAAALRRARPVLSVDTGMQRFACPPERVDAVLRAGDVDEAFTHATRVDHVERLLAAVGGRGLKLHAAATALLDEPKARLDLVRPGLALYRGAARVSARLVEASDSGNPAGYTGFVVARHGVILVGYFHGLRKGPAVVNGRRTRILEVGMQSAFVELGPGDKAGDEVVLLGDGLAEDEVAAAWGCTPHEALLRLARTGPREYLPA